MCGHTSLETCPLLDSLAPAEWVWVWAGLALGWSEHRGGWLPPTWAVARLRLPPMKWRQTGEPSSLHLLFRRQHLAVLSPPAHSGSAVRNDR